MSGKEKVGIKFHSTFLVSQTDPRDANTSDLSLQVYMDLHFATGHPPPHNNLIKITKAHKGTLSDDLNILECCWEKLNYCDAQ